MTSRNSNAVFPVLPLLGLIFVTLKLLGEIDWSWWWVTLPFWAVPAILLVLAVALLVVAGFLWLYELATTPKEERRRRRARARASAALVRMGRR